MAQETGTNINPLLKTARNVLRMNLGLSKGEKLLIITDTEKLNIAWVLFQAGLDIGAEVVLSVMRPRSRNGEEPPRHIEAAWIESDAFIAPTTYSLTHTQARKRATDRGSRGATMPGITEEIFLRTLGINYRDEVIPLCRKMFNAVKGASEIRITSPHGTDISFTVHGREFYIDSGIYDTPGSWGNLPAGEVYIAPLEETANGVVIVDGSISGGIGIVRNMVKLTVRQGRVIDISGDLEARKLYDILSNMKNDDAFNFPAELGIGCNPGAKLSGVVLEDEKILGTVHLAIGDNSTFGGKVKAGIHLDAVLLKPTLYVDGRIVIEDGIWRV